VHLILYVKPGCHLCEGLQEKIQSLKNLEISLETRDITTKSQWFDAYQYEIPVLSLIKENKEINLPRPSPRITVSQLENFLLKHL